MKNLYISFAFFFICFSNSFSAISQSTFIPKITGHFGVVHPLITAIDGKTLYNFDGSYTVSFVGAINIWKTEKWGFSLESYPTLKVENGTHKIVNFTFHPGILYRINSTTTLAGRTAFEVSGRYGITPVFTKVIKKNQQSNYYIAIPMPIRLGADKPLSATIAIQLGVSF